MKATELRVGNLVEYGGTILPVDITIFQLLFSKKEHLINPVVLTEEWLLKCGFLKSNENPYCYNSDEVNRILYYKDDFEIVWRDGGFYIWIQIEDDWYSGEHGKEFIFVHQLQNIYFVLTGDELIFKFNS